MGFYPVFWMPVYFYLLSAPEMHKIRNQELLQDAINALHNALQYVEDHLSEIILDTAFCSRLVEEFFDAFIELRPDIFEEVGYDVRDQLKMLSMKAGRIVTNSKVYMEITSPEYYGTLGELLDKSKNSMWYPSRITKRSLQVNPVPCSESFFNGSLSDKCFERTMGSRKNQVKRCSITEDCIAMVTAPRKRGYLLTHQILQLQMIEANNCLNNSRTKKTPKLLQDTLCSNVMRDAQEIADSGYPSNQHDLFMEQIGLCGMWGYRDFYKKKWFKKILQWQQKSGCYASSPTWFCSDNLMEQKIRVKRFEKELKDNCFLHKTAVAMIALATNIRFIMEDIART